MTTRRAVLKLAGSAIGLAALTACVQQAPQAPASAVATSASPTTPPAASTATNTGGSAQQLTIIQDNAVDSLDVRVAQRPQAGQVLRRINQALVTRDPKTLQPVPQLASSWSQVDPTTWEFKLVPNVNFSNGEPFNAQTVVFNFNRAMDPDLKAAVGTSLKSIIDHVEAPDNLPFRLVTKAPYAMLLERLTSFAMVPQQYVQQVGNDAYAASPIGTGPYRFVSWNQGQSVTIQRNDAYGGDKPAYGTVVYRQILESATSISELLSGRAEMVTGITPDQVTTVKANGSVDVITNPTVDVIEVRTDVMARGGPNPFTDKRVRLAANYAINKEAIATNLLGGYSQVVATNIVPQMFGFDPNVKPYPYGPNQARQLLSDAGYPNGIDVRLLYYPVSGVPPDALKQMAQAISDDLGQVGIRTTLFPVGATDIGQYTSTGKAGPIYIGGNPNGTFYDGGFGFFFLRQQYNLSYYWSDQLEQMIMQVEQGTDPQQRKQVLSQIQQFLHDEAPYVWGWTGFSLIGVSTKIDATDVIVGTDLVAERIKPRAA